MPSFAVTTAARSYQAVVERGALHRLHEFIPPRTGKLFVVTTDDVWRHHGGALEAGLAGRSFHRIVFPGGEEKKRISQVEAMADEMLANGGDRSSLVIAFGGGIVTDLGGFLAAVFMRGIPVIQIPTTLLAQVDAGVGGKTGANLQGGKNLIGAFHQPLAAIADPNVLASLPEREYLAGLAEVIKSGLIRSEELYKAFQRKDDLYARNAALLDFCIAESVRIKCEVVSEDEKESDLRRILNFGHTVAHAIEAETNYSRFLHGEAVWIGMRVVTDLSRRLAYLPSSEAAHILDTLQTWSGGLRANDLDPDRLIAHMSKDKKTIQGRVNFVLLAGIGDVKIVSGVPAGTVRESLIAEL
jgi:3-dehydroquinate synthase